MPVSASITQSVQIARPNPLPQLSLLQVITYSAVALCMPFANLYLKNQGISASHLGIILSLGAIVQMVASPLLNATADRTGKHRVLYIAFILCMITGNLVLVSFSQLFVLALARLLLDGAFSPSMTLGLQLSITRLEQEKRNLFGRIRSFSSVGFGLSSLFGSWLVTIGGYTSLFASAAVVYIISLGFIGVLPEKTAEPAHKTNKAPQPRTRAFYIVGAALFFLMMGNRAGYGFWFIHFQENLGISTGEIARLSALMALVEVPFFILLDKVLERMDVRKVFIMGGIGMSLFWLLIGIIPNPAWLYPLLIVRGLLFAVFHMATFMMVARVSVPENVATNQALIQGTIPSLAALLTGSIAGWMFDYAGAQTLFFACMVVGLIGSAVVMIGYRHIVAPLPAETVAP